MLNDLFSLKGRIALITGGSRGIGRMIAEGFVAQGAIVYISSRKADICDQTAREITENAGDTGGECRSLPFDLSTLEGVEGLATAYGTCENKLDILVNNAGAAWAEPMEDFSEKGWDKIVDLNMKTPFFLTKALMGALRTAASADRPAKVINITSIDGIRPNPLPSYSYQASKAGLIHMTRRMAAELIDDNICMSSIAPGAFASDMNVSARDAGEQVASMIPAKRIGRPADMQGAAIFLASRAGDYIVGGTLAVDGGISYGHLSI